MTKDQYSPVRLELARLVSSLLYGTRAKIYTAYDRFHGNGPYGKIPTKKEPIRTLGFALPYNKVSSLIPTTGPLPPLLLYHQTLLSNFNQKFLHAPQLTIHLEETANCSSVQQHVIRLCVNNFTSQCFLLLDCFSQFVNDTKASTTSPLCSRKLLSATALGISISST